MPRPAVLPDELDGGAFSIRRAALLGVSPKRLRASDLMIPFTGVRASPVGSAGLEQRCRWYAERMRACEVFSHRTAALLHGLPVPPAPDGRLDVGASVPHGIPRTAGIRGHRLRPSDVRLVSIRGLRAVSAVDAWCQLTPELSVRQLVVLGDALMQRRHPIASMDELRTAVHRYAGRRGSRALAAAFDQVRPRTDSPAETELRLDMVAAGLPEPEVNVPILDDSGRLIAIGDLAYPGYRVLVEYDGDHHRRDPTQYARDVDRLDDVARAGWRIIRFNRSHRGRRRQERLARVREALSRAGWNPDTTAR